MLIGLTGRNAAGKGEVAKYLQTKSFYYYSLSDAIRDELRARKLEVSREALIQVGNELRQRFGPSVLADRIVELTQPDRNYVIDSITKSCGSRDASQSLQGLQADTRRCAASGTIRANGGAAT